MKIRLHEVSLCLAIALGLGLGVPSNAQVAGNAAAAGGEDELSEIVVTARRVEERAQDVPISMSVFTQQQLTDRNIVSAGDLAAYTPSLSVDNMFGSDVTSFSVRGFVQALNTTPSVAVYFADAVVPRGGAVGEPAGSGVPPGTFFDLQNVEVLKGPQGTLFGRNTDGGAVLLVPKKPTPQFEGYLEDSYGDYDLGSVQAVLNVPVNENIRVRLGVNRETRNGYLQNITGIGPSNFDDIDYTAARLSAVVDVTPDIENYLIGSYNLSVNNGTIPQPFACNPNQQVAEIILLIGPTDCPSQVAKLQRAGPYAVANDQPNAASYLRQQQIIDTTTWHASDYFTVKNIANYGQLLTSLDSSIFGINYTYKGLPFYATMSDPSALGGLSTDQYTWSDELQLQGNALNNRLTWQGGGYLERSGPLGDVTGTRGANFLSCSNYQTFQCSGFGIVNNDIATIHFSDTAVFAQATYAIFDKLKITAGGRYTSDTTTSKFGQTNYGAPGEWPATFGSPTGVACASNLQNESVATGCLQNYRQNSHAPTYMADLDYTPIEDLMIYGKYSRGYRQGGVATFVADGFHLYAPEYVNAFEIGEKTTFSGAVPGIFNVAAFYNDFSDQQLLAAFTGGVKAVPSSGIVNAGKSHIYGAEMESAITPWKPLSVGVSYTYLVTKLVSTSPIALSPTSNYTTVEFPSVVGGSLPFSPKNKLSANASYKLPVPADLGNVSLGAIFTYTSGVLVSAATPVGYLPPYGLLNTNLTWNSIGSSTVDAELFASNITDRLYYTNVTPGLYNSPFGLESRFVGAPRMYGVRLRVRFGR
jgi:iron complex outermembrane receptor protein